MTNDFETTARELYAAVEDVLNIIMVFGYDLENPEPDEPVRDTAQLAADYGAAQSQICDRLSNVVGTIKARHGADTVAQWRPDVQSVELRKYAPLR